MQGADYLILCSALFLVLSVSIIYRNYKMNSQAKYLAYMLLYMTLGLLWILGIFIFMNTARMFSLAIILFFVSPQLLVYYMFIFIDKYLYTASGAFMKLMKYIALAILGFGLALSTYLMFNIGDIFSIHSVLGGTYTVSILNANFYTAYSYYFTAMTALTVVTILYKYLKLKPAGSTRDIKAVAWATLLSSLVGYVFNLYMPGLTGNLNLAWLGSSLAIVIFVSIINYALIRYQLFDIKTSAFRAVGYTFTLLSIAFVVTLLILKIIMPAVGQGSYFDPQVYAVTFLAVVFVGWVTPKFRKFFDKITYKLFYRNNYNPVVFAEQLSAVVTSNPRNTDLQKALLKLYHKAYSSQYLQIIVNHAEDEALNQKQFEIGQTYGSGAPPEPLKFYERLFIGHEHKNKYVLRAKIDFEEGSDESRLLEKHSIGMIAKLKLNRRVIGYLVFGEKTSGTLYTLEDIDLITAHYSEVAVALQNSTRYNRIAKFNLELQEKVTIATAKLKKSNARLRKLDKAKDDFLSIASHQLRTPLTVVRGNIDLVANGDLGPITDEAKGVLIQSERSAGRLSDLINDFLSTSRLKTGKFILDPKVTNLKYTVEQQIEQLVDFAAQRGIKLTLHKVADNLPEIFADEEKLRQVMLNTIDNAIYYSPRHKGKVDVMLYSDGKNIIYKVKDNGIGVPAHEKAKLFGRMYRADNAKNARPDGNGLGLFLMKKIIDAHNGEIIFETKEGEGSTFGFKLAIDPRVQLTRQVIS